MDVKPQHFKAVISNYGNESLYEALSSEIERRLPAAPVSWIRTFGRPSKKVVLQANFMKFNTAQFTNTVDSASTLTSKPLLHIFWTSCLDSDGYKSEVKNSILKWQKALNGCRSSDWLIIQVVYQDHAKANKSKLTLPRSSVFDKIKNEFGQKIQDRCIQLWEPDKETLFTKSGESWEALLTLLRNLLLESFGRHLESFEERIRLMRERYADPEWPFVDYFIAHEELALIYQNISLREDALVQYDEVDALLSQFIINCSGKEPPRWLQQFCIKPSNWDGVSLSTSTVEKYRTLIEIETASLIDFRNYLFARQCKLLISMNKKASLPARLMEFLFMTFQELKLLKVDVQAGSLECWIVLTCMQLFKIIEVVENRDFEFNSTLAHLTNYARVKFQHLGRITGLYFNREQTKDERSLSSVLISGFGFYTSTKKELPSCVKILRESLTSKEAYEKLFLKFSDKTIKLMANLRRLHFAMVIEIDVAKLHLEYGRYESAEPLLEKAWSIYKQQKWQFLYADVLVPLAACQLKHKLSRYINSVTLLSCAQCLPFSTRNYYATELLKLSVDDTITLPVISTDPVINIIDISIDLVKDKGHIGDFVKVVLKLRNELSIDLPCQSIYVVLKHRDLSDPRSFPDNSPSLKAPSYLYGCDSETTVSLNSGDMIHTTDISPKEVLSPSSILKKIKSSHKKTFSRSKNTINELKSESKSSELRSNSLTQISSFSKETESNDGSLTAESRTSSVPQIYTTHNIADVNMNSAKKRLFADKDEGEDLIANGNVNFSPFYFSPSSSSLDLDILGDENDKTYESTEGASSLESLPVGNSSNDISHEIGNISSYDEENVMILNDIISNEIENLHGRNISLSAAEKSVSIGNINSEDVRNSLGTTGIDKNSVPSEINELTSNTDTQHFVTDNILSNGKDLATNCITLGDDEKLLPRIGITSCGNRISTDDINLIIEGKSIEVSDITSTDDRRHEAAFHTTSRNAGKLNSIVNALSEDVGEPPTESRITSDDERRCVTMKTIDINAIDEPLVDNTGISNDAGKSFVIDNFMSNDVESSCGVDDIPSNTVLPNDDQYSPLTNNIISSDVGKPIARSSVVEYTMPKDNDDVKKKDSEKFEDKDVLKSCSTASTDDDIFLQTEDEEILDQILCTSEISVLKPGENSVELKAKINVEGKYMLHCLNCIVGNLKFYKMLSSICNNKVFFMVADPPKIVWTTDYLGNYLLTGSKQRLYATLCNGPGVIVDGSILQLSSKSGLTFEQLSPSAIQIYPLEMDGLPRNSKISGELLKEDMLLRLPTCEPYERVNFFFDVLAPMHSGSTRMTQHEISFNCLWLKDMVDSNSRLNWDFHEPFQIEYETVQKGCSVFLKVCLCAVNQNSLMFCSPKLTILYSEDVSVALLSYNTLLLMNANEKFSLLWRLDYSNDRDAGSNVELSCKLEVNFKTNEGAKADVGCFSKLIKVAFTKCLYSVETSMERFRWMKSQTYPIVVKISRLVKERPLYRLFIQLSTANQTWNYNNPTQNQEILFDNSHETYITIEMSCERTGKIALPLFKLVKLHDVEVDREDGTVDVFSSFEGGEVDYRAIGRTIYCYDDPIS